MRVVAQARVHQVEKAFHRGARYGEHHQCQRNLPGDQNIIGGAAASAAGDSARAGLDHLADVRARKLQRGPEAKQNSSADGYRHAENQNGQVDADGGFMREEYFGSSETITSSAL